MVTKKNRTGPPGSATTTAAESGTGEGLSCSQKLGVGGGESVIVDAEGLGTGERGCERDHANGARALKSVHGHLEKLTLL